MTARELPDRSAGEVIDQAHMNLVQERSVQRYANNGSFPTGVSAGELAYDLAANQLYQWDGAAWRLFSRAGGTGFATTLGEVALPSNGSEIDLLTATIPAAADASSRSRLVTGIGVSSFGTTDTGRLTFRLRRYPGGAELWQSQVWNDNPGGTDRIPYVIQFVDSNTTATEYRLTGQRVAGAGSPRSLLMSLTIVPV